MKFLPPIRWFRGKKVRICFCNDNSTDNFNNSHTTNSFLCIDLYLTLQWKLIQQLHNWMKGRTDTIRCSYLTVRDHGAPWRDNRYCNSHWIIDSPTRLHESTHIIKEIYYYHKRNRFFHVKKQTAGQADYTPLTSPEFELVLYEHKHSWDVQ